MLEGYNNPRWKAWYGSGTECADGERHVAAAKIYENGDGRCLRCGCLLIPIDQRGAIDINDDLS
jgi:hypothetical protein